MSAAAPEQQEVVSRPLPNGPGRWLPGWAQSLAAVPEARWAALSLVLFATATALQLSSAPTWAWSVTYACCYLTGGWEPGLAGLRALREHTLDVDLLMIVAALGAAAIGQVFDGALLIVIFATSSALEAWATARTEDSVRGLLELSPDEVSLISADGERRVPAADLEPGDVIAIRPGESVGADGVVVDGVSEFDQASVTGEPLPVTKGQGAEVFAGTVNGVGALRVQVSRRANESVVARIAALVEEAARTKARTQLFIEKIERRYSVGVVAATLALFALPVAFGEELSVALLRAMTFMIVASPCAVVLAAMPPLLAAIANAGRRGVLVKSALVMEQLSGVDAVAFDKTGTLTRGTPEVIAVHPVEAEKAWDTSAILAMAAAAEKPSEHPLGRAVVRAAERLELEVPQASEFTSAPGRGVRARVRGRTVSVQSPQAVALDQARPQTANLVRRSENDGHTAVVVAIDGCPRGVLALSDEPRRDAARAVAALTAQTGRSPVLLTGDNPRTAAAVAAEVGITDVHAELLPEDKVDALEQLRGQGHRVLAVGDGVNDAPALAAADAGVAMGRGGADLTLQAAGVVIVRDELDALPTTLALARRVRRTIIANLVIAATIIIGLVTWDLVGHLPLPLGVAGHEGSTVLVGLNGLRLLRHRPS